MESEVGTQGVAAGRFSANTAPGLAGREATAMAGWRPRMPWDEGFTMVVLTDRAALAVVLPTLMVTPAPQGMQ
eukprot:4098722-Karenia_brevis.AAC.1